MKAVYLTSVQKFTTKRLSLYVLTALLSLSIYFILLNSNVFAVEIYSDDQPPFGIPADVWIGKWWSWWIKTNAGGNEPVLNGCIINKSEPMVMLMETTVNGKPHQVCEISSTQGIIVPLWTGFWDADNPEDEKKTYAELSKMAREQVDLGAVTSLVKVDNNPVAKLDVVSSMRGGSLDYKTNSLDNVTEVFSKGFNITIPEDSNYPDLKSGTFRTGAHGWFVFLKPLPPGDHTLYYNVGVTGTGPNDHSAEITYDLKVK
jgi:hypothetical protein